MRLDHVVFPVRDASKALDFYRRMLKLPLVETHTGENWGGYPWLMMIFALPSGQEIVCVKLHGAPPPSYADLPKDVRHYAIALDKREDIDAWRSQLADANVDHWLEDHGERRSLYFVDPDGVILEFTHPASSSGRVDNPEALKSVEEWVAAPR